MQKYLRGQGFSRGWDLLSSAVDYPFSAFKAIKYFLLLGLHPLFYKLELIRIALCGWLRSVNGIGYI